MKDGGEGGIRTLGTLLGYGALAKRCFQPLSHLTKRSEPDWHSPLNMADNRRLPIAHSVAAVSSRRNNATIRDRRYSCIS
jgi:hypothetical protein